MFCITVEVPEAQTINFSKSKKSHIPNDTFAFLISVKKYDEKDRDGDTFESDGEKGNGSIFIHS